MIVGFTLGIFRMFVDTPVTLGLADFRMAITHGSFLWIVNNTYFQYFSVLITIVSAIVMVGRQLYDTAPAEGSIQNLTFATKTAEGREETRASWDWHDVLGSAVVLACIMFAYLYFRGKNKNQGFPGSSTNRPMNDSW